MADSIEYFPEFDTSGSPSEVSERWKKYVKKFERYLVARDVTAEKRKIALFLTKAGDAVADIYDTFVSESETEETLEQVVDVLTDHFEAVTITPHYARYVFHGIKQGPGEN